MNPSTDQPPRPTSRLSDRLFRLGYRIAFRLLRIWWFLRRPEHYGAVVAVWLDGKVLMLRQSYRSLLDFPGGSIGRGELPRDAACRELAEEVGLAVAPEALAPVRELVVYWEHRRDHVSIFELRLERPPVLRLDNREIVAADFMTPEAALARPIPPHLRAYLEAAAMP